MALSEIVNVSIQAGTVSPARRGFGVPLILMYHTAWATDEIRTYTTFTGVAADFASTSPVYKAAAALFAQSPRPPSIKVGRLAAPATPHTYRIDLADMASGATVSGAVVSPDGTSTAISVAWNTDVGTTAGDLATALAAISGLGATAGADYVDADADVNGVIFYYEFTTEGVHVRDRTADWGYDTRLDTLVTIDGDFYVPIVECVSPVNMDKIARWALANDRLAAFGPQYTKPSQFQSSEFTLGADYTALLANDQAFGLFTKQPRSAFIEAAWLGDMLPRDPGSATWAFKDLEGVGADVWTSTQRTTIESAGGNHYATEARVGITRPGKAFGGEFLDVVRGLHWLEARIQERIFAAMISNPKIPYTDEGFQILVNEVEGQLQEAEDRTVLDSGWSVTITAALDQATADRTARAVRGLEFSARLAGAVHTVNVAGTVTV